MGILHRVSHFKLARWWCPAVAPMAPDSPVDSVGASRASHSPGLSPTCPFRFIPQQCLRSGPCQPHPACSSGLQLLPFQPALASTIRPVLTEACSDPMSPRKPSAAPGPQPLLGHMLQRFPSPPVPPHLIPTAAPETGGAGSWTVHVVQVKKLSLSESFLRASG